MNKESKVEPEDLIGIYSEMAQLIGAEAVTKIYVHFKGQQIAFPTRLYTKDYIVRQPIKKMATRYGYSERRLRQMLKESREESCD